jgi:hypothetical protein
LVRRAEVICKRLNAGLFASEHRRPKGKQPSGTGIAQAVSRNAALERLAVAALARLKPPVSLTRDWRQMLAYRRKLIDELDTLVSYIATRNTRAMQSLAVSKLQVRKKLLQLATRDGFKDCAHVGSDPSTRLPPQPRPAHKGLHRTSASRTRSLRSSPTERRRRASA